ncbi:hypothetical protein O181_067057 [Austropuccinia psidii MF-1]|uniref:Uncharacterized protein n=1 Tax=Austropuccinia psidii MF-1 TaxID=1389203 RepID=A0A9Q3F032_9BASI|nr:hypothetical protein [Austropuccinia psidii MF-1]
MPCEQTLRQPTPGPSGTQWLEDLFHSKQPPFPFLILTFASSELILLPFVDPSEHNEPPIPGPSTPSEPHEDAWTREPEPEVAPIFFCFSVPNFPSPLLQPSAACLATPASVIIIDNTPVGSPPPLLPWFLPQGSLQFPPRTQPPPPLIPMMSLARNSPTCNQH